MKKIALLFGGKSAEHNISIRSCKSVFEHLDKTKYQVTLIWVDLNNKMFIIDSTTFGNAPNEKKFFEGLDSTLISSLKEFDVIWPMLHGTYGEDGIMQGYFKMQDKPFVGVDVLASSACMDKDVTKRLLRDAGIPVAKWKLLTRTNKDAYSFEDLKDDLGIPFFVKPANAGSSVGVHKVFHERDYLDALSDGFKYDNKLLIEEGINGIEVECAVMGNEEVEASVLGAIIPSDTFYSFEAKYESEEGAKLQMPAELPVALSEELRSEAIRAFKVLTCEGLSRVDFFLTKDHKYILNEINTMPGFTSISMFPALWKLTGKEYSQLLDELINLAEQRHDRDSALMTL